MQMGAEIHDLHCFVDNIKKEAVTTGRGRTVILSMVAAALAPCEYFTLTARRSSTRRIAIAFLVFVLFRTIAAGIFLF